MRYRYNLTNYNNKISDFSIYVAYTILLDIVFRIHEKMVFKKYKVARNAKKIMSIKR